MPKYFYTAKSLKGEEKRGILEAKDVPQLSQKLRTEGFILIKARAEGQQIEGLNIPLPFGGVSLTDKMFFVRNLRVMTVAGLPLPKAIGSLADQTKNQKLKTALISIKEEITKGRSLSAALSDYPDIFSELFQSMIQVGEESGTLDRVLETLNMQMEKEHSLRSKIKGAMVYPTVIVCAMLGVGFLMLVTVIPTLAATFQDLGVELPATTQAVISLANFLVAKWHLALLLLFTLIAGLSLAIKNEEVKKIIDKITLKIPVVSQLVKSSNSAYMLRTLSSLIAAGTPLPRALEITGGILENFYFREAMTVGAKQVRKGEKLSNVLESYRNIYPLIIIQMISVGEETGETSGILSKLADFFEEEVSNTAKNLTSVIEPFLMLIIGAVIGFFAVSMIQPMYSMLGSIE